MTDIAAKSQASSPARSLWFWVLFVAIIAVVVFCWFTTHRPEGFAWVSACGEDVQILVQAPGASAPSTYNNNQLPISGPITDIPEFNDCQRFIKNQQYDSSYAIFVAYYLHAAWRLLQDSVPDTNFQYIAKMGTNEVAIPVATVYSWGGAYSALGIEPGFNCLFLHRVREAGSPITPRMVPWGKTDPNCGALTPFSQGPDPRLSGGKDLVLRPLPIDAALKAKFQEVDYPQVGRWDYDSTHDEHYIGLSCFGDWCEIGDQGFVSSGPIALPPAFSGTSVAVIKGWYDQQRLASSTSPTHPSSTRGYFVPVPGLDNLNKHPALYTHAWKRVAIASVDNDYKLFRQGSNTIALCRGNADGCKIPTADRSCASNPDSPNNWWAQISPPTGDPTYKCVKQMDHGPAIQAFNLSHPGANISIPGTVRWRWRENDETTWISCDVGCCTLIQ